MKANLHLVIFFIAAMLFGYSAIAQDNREDVIYMKNGDIYRGVIVEQVPGVSYKIELAGGSVINVDAHNVSKVTKETKVTNKPMEHEQSKPYRYDRSRDEKSEPEEFVYRNKGYFFQGQIVLGFFEAGTRIINGYKFGQFGYLGLGLGLEGLIGPVNGGNNGSTFPLPNITTDYAGPYVPLFLYYSGDILRKKMTPFYSVELGYAFRPNLYSSDNHNVGGPMAGIGLGGRFYKKGRVNINLSLNLDMKKATNDYSNYYSPSQSLIMLIPSFKFGIGF
jgi:hypothetical protein